MTCTSNDVIVIYFYGAVGNNNLLYEQRAFRIPTADVFLFGNAIYLNLIGDSNGNYFIYQNAIMIKKYDSNSIAVSISGGVGTSGTMSVHVFTKA